MIGFVIGTVALVGLVAMVRRGRRFARLGGGRGFGPDFVSWGGIESQRGFGRGGRGFGGGPVRALFAKLDTTPGQERVILEAIEEARGALKDSRGELRDTRKDLAEAIRSDHFDPLLLEGTFGRHDERIASLRGALTGAIAKVHEALDAEQRVKFAEILRNGLASGARPAAPLAPSEAVLA